jgi:mitotic spindle assembly checkpoint protein MAD1
VGSARGASTQPTYNLFTGESSAGIPARPLSRQSTGPHNPYAVSQRAVSRESSKENMAPPDAEEYETQRRRIEELKAEIGTLRYTINTHEQEKELARLQHETELREVARKAEDDFKKKQAAEGEKAAAERRVESAQEELDNVRSAKEARERELERKIREAQDESRLLQEQIDDLSAAKDESARTAERRAAELHSQVASAQKALQELEQAGQSKDSAMQKAQEQLSAKDESIAGFEAEILRLKAQTGDAATVDVIRRELADQVEHIRKLEALTRDQLAELKQLRQIHKAVEVVEEEKQSLQRKLVSAELVEKELSEERIQRRRLEDERRSWAAYFQVDGITDKTVEFDSPEAMARALAEERYKTATLTEQIGRIQPELSQRDATVQSLESQLSELTTENEKLKSSSNPVLQNGAGSKSNMRLERQRALALKEVEYLRAQLKTFDVEDMTLQPESFDQKKVDRIQELEGIIDEYKQEVQSLQSDLASVESSASGLAQPATGSKRPLPSDAENEQLGQLARKNRKLQDDLSTLHTTHHMLEKELSVIKGQLSAAKESARTRVLSLRSNPTSDFEAIKLSTLTALKEENAQLLSHMQRQPGAYPTLPLSVLAAAQREIADAQAATASAEKRARRLKEVWSAKSAEFKEAIFSTLGWTVTFIPNGKMRVESVYHPSLTDEHENSIVFDGEKGTMKVGGGPRSAFAQRIADQIGFWVREKGCIPGFLAALTLEFYEEQTRASRPVEA